MGKRGIRTAPRRSCYFLSKTIAFEKSRLIGGSSAFVKATSPLSPSAHISATMPGTAFLLRVPERGRDTDLRFIIIRIWTITGPQPFLFERPSETRISPTLPAFIDLSIETFRGRKLVGKTRNPMAIRKIWSSKLETVSGCNWVQRCEASVQIMT